VFPIPLLLNLGALPGTAAIALASFDARISVTRDVPYVGSPLMSSNSYDVGDGVRATVEFRNLAGALANPTSVVAKLKNPAGTVTTLAWSHPSTGLYYVDFTFTAPGTWWLRFEGTGTVVAAQEFAMRVRPTRF
jgi:hypothetical protein